MITDAPGTTVPLYRLTDRSERQEKIWFGLGLGLVAALPLTAVGRVWLKSVWGHRRGAKAS